MVKIQRRRPGKELRYSDVAVPCMIPANTTIWPVLSMSPVVTDRVFLGKTTKLTRDMTVKRVAMMPETPMFTRWLATTAMFVLLDKPILSNRQWAVGFVVEV